MIYPSDDLANHALPVAAGVHCSVAIVFHQVQFVLESQLLGEHSEQVDTVALQLRASAHGVWVILSKQNEQPHLMENVRDHFENWEVN